MTTKGTDNRFRSLTVVGEAGTPSTPASGDFKLYVADDGTFFLMDDTGATVDLTAGGGDITTDPAWAAKGDLIAGTGNDAAAILTVGSNDKILMADSGQSTGLKWVASQTPSTQAFGDAAAEGTADTYARGDHKHAMPASPAGGVTFLGRLTASSSATLDFTSLSSTYHTYVFDFEVAPATDNVQFLMRVGTGGGPTYDTGNNYNYSNFQFVDDGTNVGQRAATGGTAFELGNAWNNTATSGRGAGTVTLYQPANGSTHPRYVQQLTRRAAGSEIASVGGGRYISATAITAVRFLFSSGNIASGTIDVYGKVHA